jgi:predicted enzyme related to lactoylglutathione lyase
MSSPAPIALRTECISPVLRVENMQAALRFYVDALGFKNAEWGNDNFTMVTIGNHGIYLCRGEQGRGGAWVWIGVESIDHIYDEARARGLTVHMPPTNFSWAYEIQLADPDGNILRLGAEPKRPIS